MASTAGFRAVLYELSAVAKELAESTDLEKLSVDDADFISMVTITINNIKEKTQ